MVWTKLEGSEYAIRKSFQHVKPRVPNFVRVKKTEVIVETPESELKWLGDTIRDLNLKSSPLAEAPVYETAPCGDKSTDVKHHLLSCKKCKVIRGIPEKEKPTTVRSTKTRKNGKSIVKFKLPGLPDFSLNGIISLMQQRRDEALQLAGDLDAAINAVTKVESINTKMGEMEKEREELQKGLAFFLHQEENKKK